jgi:hypothetical protein
LRLTATSPSKVRLEAQGSEAGEMLTSRAKY